MQKATVLFILSSETDDYDSEGGLAVSERMQITFMQARLARIASQRWKLSIAEVARIFDQYQVFRHIENCYGLYHVEGDEAIWEDLQPYLRAKGCAYAQAG